MIHPKTLVKTGLVVLEGVNRQMMDEAKTCDIIFFYDIIIVFYISGTMYMMREDIDQSIIVMEAGLLRVGIRKGQMDVGKNDIKPYSLYIFKSTTILKWNMTPSSSSHLQNRDGWRDFCTIFKHSFYQDSISLYILTHFSFWPHWIL